MKGDKIKKSCVIERDGKFSAADFFTLTAAACEKLDIPTPVILDAHTHHFVHFNNARFKPRDFIETVDFSALILENLPDSST